MLRKLKGLSILVRFELPLAAGVCTVIGELVALDFLPPLQTILFGFLSVFFLSAAALILNDVFDVESDRINAPHRPIPSGMVSITDVVIFFVVVTLAGLVFAGMISLQAFLVAIFVWMIGFLYNWKFKKLGLPGNMMVSFSVGMTFFFGGIAVNNPFSIPVLFFSLWSFFFNLGEEISADAMDMEGDNEAGSKSLAIKFGREVAIRVGTSIFFFVIAASGLPFILGWLKLIFLPPILFADAVTLISAIQLLNPNTTNRRKWIRWIYLSGLVAMLGFLIIHIYRVIS
ncbi:MAG: UbiA family prenyltransferase [Anaerolineaceae bacterium]|nr:UbiA family prenyltransferase [Anaerolineaceae bacterium]